MTWPEAALALVATAVVTVGLRGFLLRTPSPDPDDAAVLHRLATPRFVAVVSAVVLASTVWVSHWSAGWTWVPVLVLVPAAAVDACTMWIPLRLCQISWLAAVVAALLGGLSSQFPLDPLGCALGAAASGGLMLGLWRWAGFGFGDVRLALTLGAVMGGTGWQAWWAGTFLGTVVGAVWAIARQLAGQRGAFPYGPALTAGALAGAAWAP